MPSPLDGSNPYASNPAFSPLEAQVLNEYLKLSHQLKKLREFKKQPEQPHEQLLATLRSLEKKMGLVLTLYKASVWSTIIDSEAEQHGIGGGEQDQDSIADQGRHPHGRDGSDQRRDDYDDSGSEGDRTVNAAHRQDGYGRGWN